MVSKAILTYPDERLKTCSTPVDQFDNTLQKFIRALEQTRQAGPGAVGIAAPQVGHFQRIIIINASQQKRKTENHGHLVLINPEITHWEGLVSGREGCLSVPDYTGNVVRAAHIEVTAFDPNGKPVNFNMSGFEARIVQHEMDHLDGLLFLDRLVSRRSDLFRRKVYQ